MGNIISGVILLAVLSLVGSCVYETNTPEWKAQQQERAEACAKPKLMNTAVGVELWAHDWCEEHPVYFSVAGTSWTHEECHRVGKTTSCETISNRVPNTIKEPKP